MLIESEGEVMCAGLENWEGFPDKLKSTGREEWKLGVVFHYRVFRCDEEKPLGGRGGGILVMKRRGRINVVRGRGREKMSLLVER